VMASYESAALAAAAEGADMSTGLIFELPTSKWWSYTNIGNTSIGTATATASNGVGITGTLTVIVSNEGKVTRSLTGGTKITNYIPNFRTGTNL